MEQPSTRITDCRIIPSVSKDDPWLGWPWIIMSSMFNLISISLCFFLFFFFFSFLMILFITVCLCNPYFSY